MSTLPRYLIVILLTVPLLANAQNTDSVKQRRNIFIRVYDDSGRKIGKGKNIRFLDDKILVGKKADTIVCARISFIRLRHSPSYYAFRDGLIGTLLAVGAGYSGNAALSQGDPGPVSAENHQLIITNGLIVGSIVGGASAGCHLLFQKRIPIDHSAKILREVIEQHQQRK